MSSTTLTGRPDTGTPDLAALLDRRGQRRSPSAIAGHKPTRPPATKGRTVDPDAPPIEDIVKFLQACTQQRHGRLGELTALRLKTITILMWRTGLRISEALDLEERDLDRRHRSVTVRHGKGNKRRIVQMDDWAWEQLEPWIEARQEFPPGPLFCVLFGPTAGYPVHATQIRAEFRAAKKRAGIRRLFTPHSMRHACAVDGWREGMQLSNVQHQLGHARSDTTEIYLRALTADELTAPYGERKPPTMPLPLL